MIYEQIKYETKDGVLTITLNRPDKLNAFTGKMLSELLDAMDRADRDDDVRAAYAARGEAGSLFSPYHLARRQKMDAYVNGFLLSDKKAGRGHSLAYAQWSDRYKASDKMRALEDLESQLL